MTQLAIALVGLGEHARLRLLPAFRRLDDVHLVGAVDPDPAARGRAGAAMPELVTVATLDELAMRAPIDAVVVAAPPLAAPAIAEDALARDWPIYLEKPGAVGCSDLPTATAAGPVLVPGLCYRHEPAVRAVTDAIRRGDVGRVVGVRFAFTSPDPPTGWRSRPSQGGGVLRDLAIHDIDLARVLTGDEAATVTAQLSSRHGEQDTASIALMMRGGAAVQILAAQGAAEVSTLEVHGEAGRLIVDRWSAPWVARRGRHASGPARTLAAIPGAVTRPSTWRAALSGRRPGAAQERALAAFAARVRGHESDAPQLDDLRTALEVVETCERAAADGTRVAIG